MVQRGSLLVHKNLFLQTSHLFLNVIKKIYLYFYKYTFFVIVLHCVGLENSDKLFVFRVILLEFFVSYVLSGSVLSFVGRG